MPKRGIEIRSNSPKNLAVQKHRGNNTKIWLGKLLMRFYKIYRVCLSATVPQSWTRKTVNHHTEASKDKIPEVTIPLIDDCPIQGLKSCYQLANSTYKMIPQNGSRCQFIWEHLRNTNRILHREP
ncbi:hypothetical protein EDD15DRAFT_2371255 [Pisolithus albus]|nr:hypothetical protein EDD15DRAFT_2371255 [Pisolithus albus]